MHPWCVLASVLVGMHAASTDSVATTRCCRAVLKSLKLVYSTAVCANIGIAEGSVPFFTRGTRCPKMNAPGAEQAHSLAASNPTRSPSGQSHHDIWTVPSKFGSNSIYVRGFRLHLISTLDAVGLRTVHW